jgi:A/G-specific adenine glycosylase
VSEGRRGRQPKAASPSDPVIPSASSLRKIRQITLRWGAKNYRAFPWRNPDENWHGLLAEILLQRTRANTVVSVYQQFVFAFATPSKLGRASIKRIEKLLYPLGLRWRAPLIKRLGQELHARGSQPPTSLPELITLPGIGPYAAAAYLGFHTKSRAVIIDANVVRFLCRLVGVKYDGETRRKQWLLNFADRMTPRRNVRRYNYSVLDFTMQICTTRPKCEQCPVGPAFCVHGRRVLNT